ncbi:MAG: alpha-2-macroglobulin family protein, partial [Bacteroidota bacterium]
YDVNYQKVSELQLQTNEYGTFSGTFDIPTGLLNGQMQIYTTSGSKYISVEEYKRPKFETSMLPFNGNYRLNDSVEVKGSAKSFAGSSLSDANVTYRVVRRPMWRGYWSWYWSYLTSETEIANGTTITDEKGEYKIKFKAIPDISMPKNNYLDFVYSINVDVTDINGETQSTRSSINIGYTALKIDIDIPGVLNKEFNDTFEIQTLNLNNEFIPATGQLKIFKLEDYAEALNSRRWSNPDKYLYSKKEWQEKFPGNIYKDENEVQNLNKSKEVINFNFDTKKSKDFNIKDVNSWDVGRYKIEMLSKDAFGNDISYESYFTLYGEKEKILPYNTNDWFAPVKTKGEPGEFAKFLIGSSRENIKVLYEIEHKNKIISKEWLTLNKEQKLIEIGIKEEYRGNFSVHFTFVKDNRYYTHNENIYVPYTNKELDIEFETFRNKLLPGEAEEWKIVIKGPKGEKVAAEMVATLYDASLDKFKMNYWYFNIYDTYYSSLNLNSGMFSSVTTNLYKENMEEYNPYPYDYREYLDWFGFNYYGNYNYAYPASTGSYYRKGNGKNGGTVEKSSRLMMDETASAEEDESEGKERFETTASSSDKRKDYDNDDGVVLLENEAQQKIQDPVAMEDVKLRSNFNETAFFYPHLQTNEEGDIIVKFTVPESLTKWKMMGFAHSKDLMYGQIFNELVTQKELMLLPNSPRFFRENDEIEFPVKISSLSENELKGQVKLELFDALTMQPVDAIFMNNEKSLKDFTVKSQGNTLVTWRLKIPEGIQAIDYKVVAKAGKFSDGEERVVPVLTNRMLVTETMPLPIRGQQTKTFNFEKLLNSGSSKTLRHEKYTLEFTSNPAWYAVQALPYLMEYPYECAEQVFSRYYANSLASHIANSSPKIKAVFDSWKNTPDSKALLSNLEKNQELKSVLLEETPWVLNAQSETERKKRIGLLFDLNKMGNELETAIKKLMKMQSANGGWPWFAGMPECRYITQHIVTGMGHLDHLKVTSVRENKDVWKMVQNGVDYLDIRIKEDYDYLKKHYTPAEMKEKHIGYIQIQYLYARSYFRDLKIPAKCQEAFDYYKLQAEQYWLSESKYMQGMIALGLYRYENQKVPADIVKSLSEHAIVDEEMGMYWKELNGYYWYEAPIERQALLIEVFDEVAQDQKAVDDLKVWLLKQKQTQDWKTTKATVEAVYALLLKGTDWLQSDQLVEIKIGDMVIDPKKLDDVKIEAGTGYFKTSWSKGEIIPEMGKVTVTKKDEGVSWGAVYWQYFEQLDKITPAETPLKLQKKLFIEKNTASGKVIEPIINNAKLKVGDKVIVRIELRVDRAMEYVHMKDMRASGFEPINVISTYKYQGGLGYYESTKDAATNFFISYMPKGNYVFEYPLRVQHKGDFSNGITSIQCMYAPEFASHSEGIRVMVE